MTSGRASIKDVAKAAGVSLSTVSRVLNNGDYISGEKKHRVLEAIRRLRYRPNAVARSLVNSKSGTLGLCLPYLNSPFISNLMEGVEEESEKHGYEVFISHTRNNPDLEKKAMGRMLDRQVEGMIAVPALGQRHYFDEFVEQVPTIFLLRKPRGMTRNLITAADYQAARRSFLLLLENGHRDIGILAGPRNASTIRDRWRAIRELLRKYKLEIKPERIVESSFDYGDGYEAAKRLLDTNPTSIYVMHYWALISLVRLLYERRVRLPEEMSIAAYESFDDWSLLSPLKFATNIFPAKDIGVAAVSNLHDLISRKQLYMENNVEVEQKFFPHNSVLDVR